MSREYTHQFLVDGALRMQLFWQSSFISSHPGFSGFNGLLRLDRSSLAQAKRV
jgi:hypothetical protein